MTNMQKLISTINSTVSKSACVFIELPYEMSWIEVNFFKRLNMLDHHSIAHSRLPGNYG